MPASKIPLAENVTDVTSVEKLTAYSHYELREKLHFYRS
jgi:hypothetical protein